MTLTSRTVDLGHGSITYLLGTADPERSTGILAVIHGQGRGAERLAGAFAAPAARQGLTVVAPIFDRPEFRRFHVLEGRAGHEAAARAFAAIGADVARRHPLAATPLAILGFSAGAQFAHRYAMQFPERVSGLVCVAAGWYTMPTALLAYPYGCAPSVHAPQGIVDMRGFLGIPIRVMIGDRDADVDAQLRRSPALDAHQGENRLERARRWVNALADAAAAEGVSSRISLEILPNTGHSVSQAIRSGGLVQRTFSFLATSERKLREGVSR